MLRRYQSVLLLLLLAAGTAAASECRIASIVSGDGAKGTVVQLDAGSRYGLNPGSSAVVMRFDADLGVPTPWAHLQVVESDEVTATARVAATQGTVTEHMLVTFRPQFVQARAHGGKPSAGPSLPIWRHQGGGSDRERRTILTTHSWPSGRGRLYVLDSVRVPGQVVKGNPLSVGVDYSAASPYGAGTIGALITLRLLKADGTLVQRLPGKKWSIPGGGGIGNWEGLLALPADLEPGDYLIRVGLGAPGAGPLVQDDLPMQLVAD